MPSKRKHLLSSGDVDVAVASTTLVGVGAIPPIPTVRRVSKRIKKVVISTEDTTEATDVPAIAPTYKGPLTELEDEEKQPPKQKRRRKDTEPVVYDIPPVERKTTMFKGRLGYACLNTILRTQKPEPIFCSRTCRLETIRKNGLQFAKDLGLQNCRDLLKIIEWNERNTIRFFRLSSEMFPFASHGKHGYSLEYAAAELKAVGDLAKSYGHRLTTHPGQFTQLASPKEGVVTASVRELEYHCQMMRYMGLDKDSVIIIHMGGVYGDKPAALQRFRETFRTHLTDEMRARIVLENDEMCYNADELLPVCDELGIPLVFDYHHNWIYPSAHPLPELLPLISATWERRGIRQKQHLSSPRPGAETVMEKRAHADRCDALPDELPADMDLMIEAKDKEQAVFHLYRIYGLEPVVHANLRPEKPPKPFVRSKARMAADAAATADEEAVEIDADEAGAQAGPELTALATPVKRKRRGAAANQEMSVDGANSDGRSG